MSPYVEIFANHISSLAMQDSLALLLLDLFFSTLALYVNDGDSVRQSK